MKRILLVAAILVSSIKLFSQTDGMIALNSDNTGNEDKITHATGSAELPSSNAWKHIKTAMQYDQVSDLNNAIKEYGIALELDNGIAEAFDYRAVCYIKLGKYNKAMNDLENAIDINSGFVEAYNHLGIVNYWLKDYQGAINFYSRAIALNPAYATPYFNRAIVYLALEEDQKALLDLNKAKELNLDGVDPVIKEFFTEKK
jgi:tetratricopeptide (TPR) repeat protein